MVIHVMTEWHGKAFIQQRIDKGTVYLLLRSTPKTNSPGSQEAAVHLQREPTHLPLNAAPGHEVDTFHGTDLFTWSNKVIGGYVAEHKTQPSDPQWLFHQQPWHLADERNLSQISRNIWAQG